MLGLRRGDLNPDYPGKNSFQKGGELINNHNPYMVYFPHPRGFVPPPSHTDGRRVFPSLCKRTNQQSIYCVMFSLIFESCKPEGGKYCLKSYQYALMIRVQRKSFLQLAIQARWSQHLLVQTSFQLAPKTFWLAEWFLSSSVIRTPQKTSLAYRAS